jgi:hypothetical protein
MSIMVGVSFKSYMLSVAVLSVTMLSVIMLSVVALDQQETFGSKIELTHFQDFLSFFF